MRGLLLFVLLVTPLYATQYSPWLSPLWEFQGRVSFLYDREKTVQSPKGSFSAPSNDYTVQTSLGITPWPYWNVEVEVYFTKTNDIPFSYQAAIATLRYQWLDDLEEDLVSVVTGISLSFPNRRYLKDFSFAYHAEVNAEWHIALGREWSFSEDQWTRLWVLGGWGIANRGNGWVHYLASIQFQPCETQWGLFSEGLFGLGSNVILPNIPFDGYRSINHQTIDIGGYLSFPLSYLGILNILGWYNAYAHNFVEHYWGLGISLFIPFSF